MKFTTRQLILSAIFAALTAILSQISIPLPFTLIPINLATLSVLLSGALLGVKCGTSSQIVYVFLGAIGLPVFASFGAGFGIIIGPTGGYIIGYIIAALVIGIIISKGNKSYIRYLFAMIIGIIACYIIGTIWFMYITKTALITALTMCVFPFIIGDAVKIIIAAALAYKLKNKIKLI